MSTQPLRTQDTTLGKCRSSERGSLGPLQENLWFAVIKVTRVPVGYRVATSSVT